MEVLIKVGFIFGVAAGLGGFSLGPTVVDWIFGSSFEKTGELMGIGFWILIPGVWLAASTQVLHAHEKTFAVFSGLSFGVLVMVLATFIFVERYGSMGSFYALGLGMTLAAVTMLFWLSKIIGLNLVNSVLRPLISMIPCFLIPFFGEKGWIQFGIGMVTLFTCTYFFVLSAREIEILKSKIGSVVSR